MTNVALRDTGAVQEDTFSAPVMFYYMKEGHYYRTLGVGSDSKARCSISENDPNFSTVNDVWDRGVDGLIKKVHLILLGLNFETFKSQFSVNYIPEGKERYSDMITVGGVDIAEKDSEAVIAIVCDLVNKHLGDSQ